MTFEGFVPPTKNYFPVPNNWIDICAHIRDISELKVIQYVIRHTWGFHEFGICKTISVDEFMHGRRRQDQTRMDEGTGLSEQSVRNGLHKAIKDGYLICEVDPKDAGRIKKSYALRMQANTGQVQTLDPPQTLDPLTGTNFRPQGTNSYTSDSQTLDLRVPKFVPRTEKDTIEKHFKKDTIEKQGENAPINLEVKRVEKRETNPRIPITLSVSSHSQRLSETSEGEEDEEPTVKMPITKPQQPIPTTLLEAPAAPTVLPSPPKDGVQQGAMAMTARDIKKQAEKRAKELWVIIEDELHTTFTENQRKAHKDGIASLIADDISDEAMRTGLQALNTFERRTFTVQKFYGWLPTLSAKEPIFLKKASNGYQRDMVEWQGRYMTVEEADELGFNGGFGAYL